jgi:hypothetical protein
MTAPYFAAFLLALLLAGDAHAETHTYPSPSAPGFTEKIVGAVVILTSAGIFAGLVAFFVGSLFGVCISAVAITVDACIGSNNNERRSSGACGCIKEAPMPIARARRRVDVGKGEKRLL